MSAKEVMDETSPVPQMALRIFKAIQAFYLDKAAALEEIGREIDKRSLSSFGRDTAPDTRPLLGGIIYSDLDNIYDHARDMNEEIDSIISNRTPPRWEKYMTSENLCEAKWSRRQAFYNIEIFTRCAARSASSAFDSLFTILDDMSEVIEEEKSEPRTDGLPMVRIKMQNALFRTPPVKTSKLKPLIVAGIERAIRDCPPLAANNCADSLLRVQAGFHGVVSVIDAIVKLTEKSPYDAYELESKLYRLSYLLGYFISQYHCLRRALLTLQDLTCCTRPRKRKK